MRVRRIGRRRAFSDPDVVGLIQSARGRTDPYALVESKAQALLERLEDFDGTPLEPFQRICVLASLAGFTVQAMDGAQVRDHSRDAVLMPTSGTGRKGIILYNPTKIPPRRLHSVAHEITHSFIPNSAAGAQFRSLCREGSGPALELELLCDHGAAELTMPRPAFRQAVAETGFGVEFVDALRRRFGTSFEATLYRMAQTADFPVASGLFVRRLRKSERAEQAESGLLFADVIHPEAKPKYRRQSFHCSATYPTELVIPWNKSVPDSSCVYTAAHTGLLAEHVERLGADGRRLGFFAQVQAIPAPYQPDNVEVGWPNMLVLLRPR
jgi:Zn-dependent peptidase ImmA (M78 family)